MNSDSALIYHQRIFGLLIHQTPFNVDSIKFRKTIYDIGAQIVIRISNERRQLCEKKTVASYFNFNINRQHIFSYFSYSKTKWTVYEEDD